MEIDFSLPAERVVRALDQVIEWRGKPQAIRSDNGPEFISAKLTEFKEWRARSQAPAPAKPAIPPARQSRLAQAVIPNGDRSAPKAPQTEEDAFIAGFKNARAAAGY